MAKTPIVITGFMATGKSTVAPIVARKLGWSHFETDDEIERRLNLTIPEIFAQHGEETFRYYEQRISTEVTLMQHVVVSTGGGLLIDDFSRALLLQKAYVVCLDAPETVIADRLADTTGRPVASEWRKRYHERLPIYRSIPHQVDTTDKTPDAIAQEIITLWNASP